MRPDAGLLDRLGAFPSVAFAGETFRVTRRALHPLIPSRSGGRWAPQGGPAVLYTSAEPAGALAEIAFHLSLFTPPPSKPVALHRLGLSTGRTLRLLQANLVDLGVDWARSGEMDYERAQDIGAALSLLGCDGLLAASARWPCENPSLFMDDQAPRNRLEVLSTEEVDWVAWTGANARLPASPPDGSAPGARAGQGGHSACLGPAPQRIGGGSSRSSARGRGDRRGLGAPLACSPKMT